MSQTALASYKHAFTFMKSRKILFLPQISQSKMKCVRKAFLVNFANSVWDHANSQMFALFFCKRNRHQRAWLGPLQKPRERIVFPTSLMPLACMWLGLPNCVWTKATPAMFCVHNSYYMFQPHLMKTVTTNIICFFHLYLFAGRGECAQKPEVGIRCPPQVISTLVIETLYFTEHGAWQDLPDWLPSSFRNVLSPPPQKHTCKLLYLMFHVSTRDSNSGLHACTTNAFLTEPSLQPTPWFKKKKREKKGRWE